MRSDYTITDSERTNVVVRWRTIAEYADMLREAIASGGSGGGARASAPFAGTANASEYLTMLETGWPDGVHGVEGLDGLSVDAEARPTLQRSVAGCFPSVPDFIAGSPLSMYDVQRLPSEHQSVCLVINAATPGSTDASVILEYAHSVMRLIAALHAQHLDAAIVLMVRLHMGSRDYCYPVRIRELGQVLQPERIAATLHPSWLRRAFFSAIDHDAHNGCKDAGSASNSGYGSAQGIDGELCRQLLPDARSVLILPQPGEGDPTKAVQEALSVKLRAD